MRRKMEYKIIPENVKIDYFISDLITNDLKKQESKKKEVFIKLCDNITVSISQGFSCANATEYDFQLNINNIDKTYLYKYMSFDGIVNVLKILTNQRRS